MSASTTPTLPWLERLNMQIPGYRGYQQRPWRRSADEALRDALLGRLAEAAQGLTAAQNDLRSREVTREVEPLAETQQELARITERVRTAPSFDPFFEAQEFGVAQSETLHALDHALLDGARELVDRIERNVEGHDWLASVRTQIGRFEATLDGRVQLLQRLT